MVAGVSFTWTMGLLTRIYRLRWPSNGQNLRAVAEQIHERVRASVVVRVERGEAVHFVSGGLATPPGPTRLVLEDRRRGLPGRRFGAVLQHAGTELQLSVETSCLRPIPLELLEPLLAAVRAIAPDKNIEWITE